jgi:hypothetical protein
MIVPGTYKVANAQVVNFNGYSYIPEVGNVVIVYEQHRPSDIGGNLQRVKLGDHLGFIHEGDLEFILGVDHEAICSFYA